MKLFLNCTNNLITLNKKDYLLRAAKRLGFDWVIDYEKRLPDDKIEYVLNIEPYIPFIKGERWTGIWEIDLIFNRDQLSMTDWNMANTVFIANEVFPQKTLPNRHLTQVLFQACDPVLHRPIECEKEFDFIFSGSAGENYSERERTIGLLKKYFTFWDYGKNRSPEEYVRILNLARVQFIRTCNTPTDDGHLAQRFFECLAIGPVLTNYHEDLALTGLVEGKDYLCYRNDKEMLAKMDMLIKHSDLAKEIATNGRRKALLYHTYDNRLISIINNIKYG